MEDPGRPDPAADKAQSRVASLEAASLALNMASSSSALADAVFQLQLHDLKVRDEQLLSQLYSSPGPRCPPGHTIVRACPHCQKGLWAWQGIG